MTVSPDSGEFRGRMQELEGLLRQVDDIADATVRDRTARIIQSLLDFHGAGLAAVMSRLTDAGDAGRRVIDELARDELVSGMLLLYDLHPLDREQRVKLALDRVRPYLASHGGNVELISISDEGVVRLRMQGSCHGCPSSAMTLRNTIEQAICETAPDVAAVRIEDDSPPPAAPAGFVPIERLTTSRSAGGSLPQGVAS